MFILAKGRRVSMQLAQNERESGMLKLLALMYRDFQNSSLCYCIHALFIVHCMCTLKSELIYTCDRRAARRVWLLLFEVV